MRGEGSWKSSQRFGEDKDEINVKRFRALVVDTDIKITIVKRPRKTFTGWKFTHSGPKSTVEVSKAFMSNIICIHKEAS